jgi:hypothetical protein
MLKNYVDIFGGVMFLNWLTILEGWLLSGIERAILSYFDWTIGS